MKKKKFDLKNPKIRNPLLIILVGLSIGYMWYEQFYREAKLQLEVATREKNEKENELRTILALRPQLNVLRQEKREAELQLDSLRSMFPDQKEVPGLIQEISTVARASQIITTKFNPLPDVEQEHYVENRYNVAVAGMYHNLGEFFAFLANFPLIINLSSVIISANPGYDDARYSTDVSDIFVPSIVATFEMTTFSSKP
ncbi:type 4a pilus biogenesis protein PilO [Chitinispirillales bacterium ANBcel5]|uniref:type 4a pilus biogenesis protein PilO n=1 Tax=Cellulosispirillum alkaliphilum TaxID=3039283 RepID=UPI002A5675A3|nr:type 4a pilus biogenesis protein PilO [Chitinispirillales bacterium ANBcel5]